MLMAECCFTFPPASWQFLPRSSGEGRPLRCPRCWQSSWRRLETQPLNHLPMPPLPWPSEPRPRLRPVSPLPQRHPERQHWLALCGSGASSISPISLSRRCPWLPHPQHLNLNSDPLRLQQLRPRPCPPHPRKSLTRPLLQAFPPQLLRGNLSVPLRAFLLQSSLVRPSPLRFHQPPRSPRSKPPGLLPQALLRSIFLRLWLLDQAAKNQSWPPASAKLSHWPPTLRLPVCSPPRL